MGEEKFKGEGDNRRAGGGVGWWACGRIMHGEKVGRGSACVFGMGGSDYSLLR